MYILSVYFSQSFSIKLHITESMSLIFNIQKKKVEFFNHNLCELN